MGTQANERRADTLARAILEALDALAQRIDEEDDPDFTGESLGNDEEIERLTHISEDARRLAELVLKRQAPAEVCGGTGAHEGQSVTDCDECSPNHPGAG